MKKNKAIQTLVIVLIALLSQLNIANSNNQMSLNGPTIKLEQAAFSCYDANGLYCDTSVTCYLSFTQSCVMIRACSCGGGGAHQ